MIIGSGWYVMSQTKNSTGNSVSIKVHSRPFKDKFDAEQWKDFKAKPGREYFVAAIPAGDATAELAVNGQFYTTEELDEVKRKAVLNYIQAQLDEE